MPSDDFSEFDTENMDFSEFDTPPEQAPAAQKESAKEPDQVSTWKTLLNGIRGVGAGALSGFDDEAASVVGAGIDKLSGDDRSFGELYQDARKYMRADKDKIAAESPIVNTGGQVLGAAPLAIASMGANPIVAGAGMGFLQGLGDSDTGASEKEFNGTGLVADGLKGAAFSAAASYAVPKILGAGKQLLAAPVQAVKSAVGDAMQVPQKAVDAVAEKIGKTQIAQKIGAASDIPESMASARVKALKSIIQEADVGKSMSSAINQEIKDASGFADKVIEQLDDSQRIQLGEALSRLMKERGIERPAEYFSSNLGKLAELAGIRGEITPSKLLRTANKASIKNAIFRLDTAKEFFGSGLIDDIQEGVLSHLDDNAAIAAKMRSGQLDQFGRAAPEKGRGMLKLSEIDSVLDADSTKNIRRPQPVQPPAPPPPTPEQIAAQEAQRELANIATGRNAIKESGGILGALGGAVGTLTGGVYGAGAGAIGGAQLKNIPKAADVVGSYGQMLSDSAKPKLELALKAMSDKNLLARAARDPGALGSAARWVIDGAKGDPSAVAARSFILAMQPEFRSALANDVNLADPDATPVSGP